MSQIETNPLLNPTTATFKQNQILVSRPPLPTILPTFQAPFIRKDEPFRTEQVDPTGVAAMQKFLGTFSWTLAATSGTLLFTYDLTLENLLAMAPFGTNVQAFANLESILFSIENTNNAFFQGSLIAFFDPAPSSFWATVYGSTIDNNKAFQFPGRFLIEPKTRNASQILIPINIPFNLFQILSDSSAQGIALRDYVRNYSFGSLIVRVNTQLQTKSLLTSHHFRVTGLLNGLQLTGSNF